jgi:hypothetical protein
MEPQEREDLEKLAKSLNLKPAKNIGDAKLRDMVERARIAHTIEIEEQERERLQAAAKLKRDIADIEATAKVKNIKIDIPKEPTLTDVIALRKELDMKVKEPIPSPEYVAIHSSQKVYATFHNTEQDDLDVKIMPGGVLFHLWPERVHVIPKWLIGHCNRQAVYPIYEDRPDPVNPKMVRPVKVGNKRRWIFEEHSTDINGKPIEPPKNASFGVVLDDKVLNKILQPVM